MSTTVKTEQNITIYEKAKNRSANMTHVARREWRILIAVLLASDIFLTLLAFRLAFWIRFAANWSLFQYWFPPTFNYAEFSFMIIPIWVIIFVSIGLYNRENILGGTREYSLVFNATTLGVFLTVSIGFLLPDNLILARGWVIMTWLLSAAMVGIGRFAIRRVVYKLREAGHFQNRAILVGDNAEACLLTEQLINCKTAGLKLIGFISSNEKSSSTINGLKKLGGLSDLSLLIEEYDIQDVILVNSALSQEEILDIFKRFGTSQDVDLRMSSGLYEIITTGMQIKEDGMVPMVVVNKVRMTGIDQVVKTIIDYGLALVGSIILFPAFILIGIAIKLDSPGPIIHRRKVMGVNGKQFYAYKFRTMRQNADEILASNPEMMNEYKNEFKLKDDPRITRLGKYLRKASIDELPQVFNVLRNEMSIVGPRMICPEELEKYNQWGVNLLTVKPGITGFWQVRGRSDVSYEQRVQLDMYYIRNWTIWLDIQLIIQTIPAVLSRRGAY